MSARLESAANAIGHAARISLLRLLPIACLQRLWTSSVAVVRLEWPLAESRHRPRQVLPAPRLMERQPEWPLPLRPDRAAARLAHQLVRQQLFRSAQWLALRSAWARSWALPPASRWHVPPPVPLVLAWSGLRLVLESEPRSRAAPHGWSWVGPGQQQAPMDENRFAKAQHTPKLPRNSLRRSGTYGREGSACFVRHHRGRRIARPRPPRLRCRPPAGKSRSRRPRSALSRPAPVTSARCRRNAASQPNSCLCSST